MNGVNRRRKKRSGARDAARDALGVVDRVELRDQLADDDVRRW